jgi:hypothetical protein
MKTLSIITQAFIAVVFIVVLSLSCEKNEEDVTAEGAFLKAASGADTLLTGDSSYYGDSVFYGDTVYYGDPVNWGDSSFWNNPGPIYDSIVENDSVIWVIPPVNPPVNPYDSSSWFNPIIPGDTIVAN